MRDLRLDLETTTPLFLSGADPRGAPELRPPAFRGALRYWLRAALGGALGDDEAGLAAVRQAESAVFGGAGEEGGGASPVTVRVRGDPPPAQEYRRGPAGWDPATGRQRPSGRDYLFWSMDRSGSQERGNYQPPKRFFPPGTTLTVELLARPGVREADSPLRRAAAALWLLVNLGGVGSRSRRTGGSLSAPRPFAFEGLPFALEGPTPGAIARELAGGLRLVRAQFHNPSGRDPGVPPRFDVLHPSACRVWVLGTWGTWEEGVEALGAAMRDFRSRSEPDHQGVARWLQGGSIATVQRAAFGLPLAFRYSNGLRGEVAGRPREIDRRASPLWLRLSRTVGGRHVGVATLFASLFLPPGEGLFAGGHRAAAPPGYELIERFVRERFDAVEVRYE